MWSVYMIRCGDRSLYTGISNNVSKRFEIHQSGNAQSAKYTRTRHPLKLVFTAEIGTKSAASRAEYRIKKLPKKTKELLVTGMTSLTELGIVSAEDLKKVICSNSSDKIWRRHKVEKLEISYLLSAIII